MATTVMDIINKINKSPLVTLCVLSLFIEGLVPIPTFAGDWQLKPNLSIDETFTDNVNVSSDNTKSSFVTQASVGLDAEYKSNLTTLQWSGNQIYAIYSHDSDFNNNFRTLEASGKHSFWRDGPQLKASANIANISQNTIRNGLADLTTGDTIEQKNYSTGLQYDFGNSNYTAISSLDYSITRAEDNIGEYDRFTANFDIENSNTARHLYWEVDANYTKREQKNSDSDGENNSVEALLGAITSLGFNPFIRYYDENVQGTGVNENINTTSSWGPGVRWLATPHIIVDLSYNFANDETVSDDYIDTSVQWEPSSRTSLTIGYSQRFFGDSYNFNFKHRTKRLTNSITYDEGIAVFDRNSYQEVAPEIIELVESDEFSLNKRFTWSSQLEFSRTSFSLNISGDERKSFETNIVNDVLDASFSMTRTLSPKSSLSLNTAFNHATFDKENPLGSRQEDYYHTLSINFTRSLASSLFCNFTMKHVNRNSSNSNFNYNEIRAIINITKEF